ncbi:hypothetical protein ACTXQV_83220, partial [Klebsiella pneumoniae]
MLFYFWSARSQHCEQLTPVLERLLSFQLLFTGQDFIQQESEQNSTEMTFQIQRIYTKDISFEAP